MHAEDFKMCLAHYPEIPLPRIYKKLMERKSLMYAQENMKKKCL